MAPYTALVKTPRQIQQLQYDCIQVARQRGWVGDLAVTQDPGTGHITVEIAGEKGLSRPRRITVAYSAVVLIPYPGLDRPDMYVYQPKYALKGEARIADLDATIIVALLVF